ncbi:MAG: hypothetical protein ABSE20_06825, partial [Acetobacteraceae bacterium]
MGIVTLTSTGCFEDARTNAAPITQRTGRTAPPPIPESLGANLAISAGGDQVSAWMEVTVDESVSRKEILSLPG